MALIDAEYTRHPFYGSRKMTAYRRGLGYRINRKRVQRLLGVMDKLTNLYEVALREVLG